VKNIFSGSHTEHRWRCSNYWKPNPPKNHKNKKKKLNTSFNYFGYLLEPWIKKIWCFSLNFFKFFFLAYNIASKNKTLLMCIWWHLRMGQKGVLLPEAVAKCQPSHSSTNALVRGIALCATPSTNALVQGIAIIFFEI
jgi:hypothetical protein